MKLLKYIRVPYRAPAMLAWTLFSHYAGVRLPRILNPKTKSGKAVSMWGRGLVRIMGIRIHEVNERPEPMGDVVISNHMGFLDVPVISSFFPAVYIIKMEMRRVPYFGATLAKGGHVFVERNDKKSRLSAGKGAVKVLKGGERLIVFPEGRASPGAERLPFAPYSFAIAKRLGKTVQACAIDYLPDRRMLEWDVTKPTVPQLLELLGRPRTDISIEFFPAELVDDPREMAKRYHDLIESRLKAHDQ
ncbi:MAG: 1-acyl-sn-glycerol-3-phosphate acyltransferase [Proteobacteria bacterium]|nr:1-acyl-sn-glycerol-3-phosphate acyltransferase [Pseudomonadota bacterium]